MAVRMIGEAELRFGCDGFFGFPFSPNALNRFVMDYRNDLQQVDGGRRVKQLF